MTTERTIIPEIRSVNNLNQEFSTDQSVRLNYNSSPQLDINHDLSLDTSGNLIMATNRQNLEQWISKALATPISHYISYNRSFGNLINNLIGQIDDDILESIAEGVIRELLISDPRIFDLANFSLTKEDDRMFANFSVITYDFDNIDIERSFLFI